jgi:hypothetical protein
MDTIKISFDVTNRSQHHNLGIELWIDRDKFFDSDISPGQHHIIHSFDAADGEHVLRAVLKNKTAEHTQVDESGNIIEDALIHLGNITLDEINVTQLVYQLAQYVHDGNGHETIAVHRFYGDLGCNGHVQMSFQSPVYLWLLENM